MARQTRHPGQLVVGGTAGVTSQISGDVEFVGDVELRRELDVDGAVTLEDALSVAEAVTLGVPLAAQYGGHDAGDIKITAAAATPTRWAECDGGTFLRHDGGGSSGDQTPLFAAIGTAFGAGDGSTTANRPDLRGRVPLGAGNASGRSNRARGASGGAETVALLVANLPSHSHGAGTLAAASAGGHAHTATSTLAVASGGGHKHGAGTLDTGSAGGHGHSLTGTLSAASGGGHTHGAGTLGADTDGAHSHRLTGTLGTNRDAGHTHGDITDAWARFSGGNRTEPGSGNFHNAGTNTSSDRQSGTGGRHDHSITGRLTVAIGGGHTHDVTGSTATGGAHTHNVTGTLTVGTNGAHTHNVSGSTATGGAHTHALTGSLTVVSAGAHTHNVTGSTASVGSGTKHENMPPWLGVRFVIFEG